MSDKQTDAELIAWLRSGLDNCDRDSEGLELGGVVMAMSVAADRIEALIRENTNLRQIERNVQAVREHEFKRAEAAKAKLELGRHGTLFLRRAGRGIGVASQAVGARRA